MLCPNTDRTNARAIGFTSGAGDAVGIVLGLMTVDHGPIHSGLLDTTMGPSTPPYRSFKPRSGASEAVGPIATIHFEGLTSLPTFTYWRKL